MRKTCLNEIYELAKKDERVVFIGSDLTAGTLSEFQKEMPERFFMEGVSEANIIGMAAGMAMSGKIPYVNTIATFITRRCYEQIVDDVAMHNLPVRLIGNGGGLVYAPLGPTHLAIDDMAIMSSMPNMTVVAVSDAEEMKRFMPETLNYKGPIYIRLAKGGDPIVSMRNKPFRIGKGILIKGGGSVLVVTCGICLKIALEAEKMLKEKKIDISILHLPTVKPVDKKSVLMYAKQVLGIVTIEEGIIHGGLGSSITGFLIDSGSMPVLGLRRIGLPDKFPEKYGSQNEQLRYFGITGEVVSRTIVKLLKGRQKHGKTFKYHNTAS